MRDDATIRLILRRFSLPLTLFVGVIVLASVGYYLLWRPYEASWLDAIYMTIITVTTVGYAEVHPLDTSGRILTIVISIMGIGSFFYLFSAIMEMLVITQVRDPYGRKKMQSAINQLSQHIIVAGFGRLGQRIADELKAAGSAFVVIDERSDSEALLRELGYLYVIGDAEEDDILERSGVKQAKALIAATGDDAANAFIVMSARGLNAKLLIVARADEDAAMRKMRKAGADQVINAYAIAGQRLVNMVLKPVALDFISRTLRSSDSGIGILEFAVPATSTLSY
jgi:voltage-gated potassium channel